MKLSQELQKFAQYMRRGAKLGRQLYGAYTDDRKNSCALGAILLATDRNTWPPVGRRVIPKEHLPRPLKGNSDLNLSSAVVILNDTHKWPREKIADWIECWAKAEKARDL